MFFLRGFQENPYHTGFFPRGLPAGRPFGRGVFHFSMAGMPFSTLIFLHFWSIKNYDIISIRYCLHVLTIVIFKIFLSVKMWKISLQHYRKCKFKSETVHRWWIFFPHSGGWLDHKQLFSTEKIRSANSIALPL